MKHLIIYAHPNKASLNHHFKQTIVDILTRHNHDVIVRDLYHLNFNPILSLNDMAGQRKGEVSQDVKQEQDFISWADTITLIYPIWWTGMPAIMKGYIDRVFSYGFAYRYDQGIQKGLLSGKRIFVINTQGKSKIEYKETGMDQALCLTSDKGIFSYCGLLIKQHFFFDKADIADQGRVKDWTVEIAKSYLKSI
ncbi:NAD(P)H-dependent oxidoreductase [Aureibaculum algae]|uniref:NAD(P)H-dependent oxidoreductase n=1 Tax=Aureibaculum algae TaxID=2584122 RepID=A0A5B7TQD7_9FLAO|nr:NAD(P)H-dependent oxidoreductase [Aureibaculum algae]QCX37356.1 NAD(P)H-dependent oxidoreductase [Aureibaculum algae]